MRQFPRKTKFRFTWRPYQERVLSELEEYLDDERLHVVAAPGSGKTLLGLEVVRRLNNPTLILAPTLAIRDQWINRLIRFFLPKSEGTPDWISRDIRNPKFLTVSTYQALYVACGGIIHREDYEEEELDEDYNDDNNSHNKLQDITPMLEEIGIETIVLDEAHHLRTNWWRVLTQVIESIPEATVLSLTATPPYDVSIYEWQRYIDLCGPVDAEVSVPELVLERNLCPHQDLVLLTAPSFIEDSQVKQFKDEVKEFLADLKHDVDFTDEVSKHPWLKKPELYV
ncbi:MAG: DEAD/DEAH box helicase family protein, partial [Candidatus Thorarchaeota archaeon]